MVGQEPARTIVTICDSPAKIGLMKKPVPGSSTANRELPTTSAPFPVPGVTASATKPEDSRS